MDANAEYLHASTAFRRVPKAYAAFVLLAPIHFVFDVCRNWPHLSEPASAGSANPCLLHAPLRPNQGILKTEVPGRQPSDALEKQGSELQHQSDATALASTPNSQGPTPQRN